MTEGAAESAGTPRDSAAGARRRAVPPGGRPGGYRRLGSSGESDSIADGPASGPDGPGLRRPAARPRIVEDPGIFGLSRVARSRLGSRLFAWFFVFVFALILVQMIVALLTY